MPNVVFVLTDDQGYGDLGCHGNRFLQTPHLDSFHSQSVRFTDFHCGTTCAPTRAGLLTGHHCNSAGVWHTVGGRSLLRPDEWTLADALRDAGYATGHFGKWHLGDTPPFRPHERGFTQSIWHAGGGIGNTGDHWGNDYFDDTYLVNGEPRQFQGYCTDVFFREALAFIAEHRDVPFFCYLAPNAPHGPWNVEAEYRNRYRDVTDNDARARFYGMISNLDDNFGRLRAELRRLGLEEDTILIFSTDNGTALGVDLDNGEYPLEGPGSFNSGMRGIKGSPYEGGHRVPLFLRYPGGGLSEGRDVGTLASYVDFMPTVLDLCGVAVPASRSFHGQSLVPLLHDGSGAADTMARRILVTDTQRVPHPMKWRNSCTMHGPWRLIHGKELYNIQNDPGERADVARSHPGIVARLRAGYEEWWQAVSGQFDQDVPISLGQSAEAVRITTHDIRNETGDTAWNQRHVRQGLVVNGYWAVDVIQDGRYRIELFRWPPEADRAITAGISGDDVEWRRDAVEERFHAMYTGGLAIPVEWARLQIGGAELHAEIDPNSRSAVFELDLQSGPDRLYASLHDRAERSIAPYYVYVRLMVAV